MSLPRVRIPPSPLSYFGRIRTPKGVGKVFSHVVGVTGATLSSAEGERRQRGRAPMEICEANLGFRAQPGIPPSPVCLSCVMRIVRKEIRDIGLEIIFGAGRFGTI